ncbi:MAG: tRNA-dihydrouridine synthase [Gammaproteobacteria bacterium]|nr:tRNA-dihydrouridine synthase [Gammaproteobacteria bacterium]
MKIYLAPMEGVVDHYMRDLLTTTGGYTYCVTEFVRVVDRLLPAKVFRRICPELNTGGKTAAGIPVILQLLGSEPQVMADNAARAVELGAPGIDINFGCPSKTVNRSQGGAVLLKEPQRLYDIVAAVRQAVPAAIPVSAKIRLGFDNTDLAEDNALAVQSASADFITVHARTRKDGYQAPARWEWLAKLKQCLDIPMVANGDINSVEDYQRCIDISGCKDVMLGRGAVARPDLARQIQHYQRDMTCEPIEWDEIRLMLQGMASELQENIKDRYILPRIKQWLVYLRKEYQEAHECFEMVRPMKSYSELSACFK